MTKEYHDRHDKPLRDGLRTIVVTGDVGDQVQVSMFKGDDGAVVVQVDTDEGAGHLRVNVNDAPVFDQDPESEDAIAEAYRRQGITGLGER